jgi:hypothetical protein
VATRAPQETAALNAAQALAFVERHGIVSESARRGTIPVLVDAIAGEAVRGNWWSHPLGKQIFAITRQVRDAPQVLVCRLVDGKITHVHERLWPALVRGGERFPREYLARVREVHTSSGKHELAETPFPDWASAKVKAAARRLSESEAAAQLQPLLALAQN